MGLDAHKLDKSTRYRVAFWGVLLLVLGWAPELIAGGDSNLTSIQSATCEMLHLASNKVVIGAGGLAIVFTGIMAFFGRMDWGTVLVTVVTIGVAGGGIQMAEYFLGDENQGCILSDTPPDDEEDDGTQEEDEDYAYRPKIVVPGGKERCTSDYLNVQMVPRGAGLDVTWKRHPDEASTKLVATSNKGCWDEASQASQEFVVLDQVMTTGESTAAVMDLQQCTDECVQASAELVVYRADGSLLCHGSAELMTDICPPACTQDANSLTVDNSVAGHLFKQSARWEPHVNAVQIVTDVTSDYRCAGRNEARSHLDGQTAVLLDAQFEASATGGTCVQECLSTSVALRAFNKQGDEICNLRNSAPEVCAETFCTTDYLELTLEHEADERVNVGDREYRMSAQWRGHPLVTQTTIRYRYTDNNGTLLSSGEVTTTGDQYDLPPHAVPDGGGCVSGAIEIDGLNAEGEVLCSSAGTVEEVCFYPICNAEYLNFTLSGNQTGRNFSATAEWVNHPLAGPETSLEVLFSGDADYTYYGRGGSPQTTGDYSAHPFDPQCFDATATVRVRDAAETEICSATADLPEEMCFANECAAIDEVPVDGQPCCAGSPCDTLGGTCQVDCPVPCAPSGQTPDVDGYSGCCEGLRFCATEGVCRPLCFGIGFPDDDEEEESCLERGSLSTVFGVCCSGLSVCNHAASDFFGRCSLPADCCSDMPGNRCN